MVTRGRSAAGRDQHAGAEERHYDEAGPTEPARALAVGLPPSASMRAGSSLCWFAGRLMTTLCESRCCKAATQLCFCNTRSGILDR